MKINKIKVNGFSKIKETAIDFNQSNLKALIALNNYGKSNLLQSFSFAEDFIKVSDEQKSLMMRFLGGIPINNNLDRTDFEFEVEFATSFERKEVEVNYMFSFSWIKGSENRKSGEKISGEYLRIKEAGKNSRYAKYINRDKEGSFYLSSPSGRCTTPVKIKDNELIVNKLKYYDNLFFHKIVEDINQLSFSITSLLDVDNAFNAFMIPDSVLKENSFDVEDGRNICRYIYYLKNKRPDKYELLVNSLKDLIPGIEDIEPVELNFNESTKEKAGNEIPFVLPEKIYDIRIKEKFNNQYTSIKMVSSGTKRIVLILASAIKAGEGKVHLLAFEELENSIHPNLLQKLLVMLNAILPNCRMIITSHSPYLVQYLDLDDIYVGIPNQNGIACFKKVKKSRRSQLLNRADDENSTLGDYLFNMMIEGIADEEIFNEYIGIEETPELQKS
ncbi:MAG: AAA family ATPase [Clostridiales bacterium]